MLAGDDDRRVREVLLRSVASFATLFRHALIALGETPPMSRREAVLQLSSRLGFDPSAMEKILDIRERKADSKRLHALEIVSGYVHAVETVIAAVDTIDGPNAPISS